MEIRTIATFVRIAELKSFSRAARQLGYSQSAVTMQMKQLEEEFQVPLFERVGKGIALTQAGERLLPKALELLAAARALQETTRPPLEVTGKLRVGTAESLLISVLPPVLMEFGRLCPKAEVSTCTGPIQELFRMLRQNEIDVLYFLDEKTNFPYWVKVMERQEPAFFVASSANALAGRANVTLERLLQEPFVLTERGISYRYAMEQALAEKGMELHPFLETGNTDVITKLLLENQGVSFLPEFVVREYLKSGRLTILDVACPGIQMWSQLVYHRDKYMTPQLERFLELMKSRLGGEENET